MKLSILLPVFNEAATLASAVTRVLDVPYPCDIELVVVDGGSSDDTAKILAGMTNPRLVHSAHLTNRGKGAAIRTRRRDRHRQLHSDLRCRPRVRTGGDPLAARARARG